MKKETETILNNFISANKILKKCTIVEIEEGNCLKLVGKNFYIKIPTSGDGYINWFNPFLYLNYFGPEQKMCIRIVEDYKIYGNCDENGELRIYTKDIDLNLLPDKDILDLFDIKYFNICPNIEGNLSYVRSGYFSDHQFLFSDIEKLKEFLILEKKMINLLNS